MSDVLLKTEALTKIYEMKAQSLRIIDGLNIEIGKGDFVVIEGVSGCGKSTLLQILGLMDENYQGKLWLTGIDVALLSSLQRAHWRNSKIGFVFQFFHLLSALTVLENVMLPLMIAGVPRKQAALKAELWLERVTMVARKHHKPAELSGGEQQRVAIARALVNDPQLLLCDEPTGNLDEGTSAVIEALIEDLHRQEGKTVVLVTHDKAIAARHKTRYHLTCGILSPV